MNFLKILPRVFRASIVVAPALLFGGAMAAVPANSALEHEAKISKSAARNIALNRVPEGTVKTARLERENGKLVWHFDIVGYHGRSRQDVVVDATTGDVVASKARALSGPTESASVQTNK